MLRSIESRILVVVFVVLALAAGAAAAGAASKPERSPSTEQEAPIPLDVERLVSHGVFAPRLALGPDASIHILYALGQELRLRVRRDDRWSERRLDFAGAPYSRALAVDAAGAPHVAVVSGSSGLFYALLTADGWADTRLVRDAPSDSLVALALDSRGRPHLALNALGTVGYIHRTNGQWQAEELGAASSVREPAIALDGDDLPAVAYEDPHGRVVLARRGPDGTWAAQGADVAGPGYSLNLALDALDRAHVALDAGLAAGQHEIQVLTSEGGSWRQSELPDQFATTFFRLALDASGRPNLAHPSRARRDAVHYRVLLGDAWSDRLLGFGADARLLGVQHALDATGQVHLAARSQSSRTDQYELLYATLPQTDLAPTVGPPTPTATLTSGSSPTAPASPSPTGGQATATPTATPTSTRASSPATPPATSPTAPTAATPTVQAPGTTTVRLPWAGTGRVGAAAERTRRDQLTPAPTLPALPAIAPSRCRVGGRGKPWPC